ncbi:TPA: hypothetical protein GFY33_28635, partial [Escherichia coli]|nr:hypothetical protein [Escherichia coli]
GERQTVENPETGELLWQHETTHAYNEQGLANRVTPDSLPPVEWLTYGSGYLAGMNVQEVFVFNVEDKKVKLKGYRYDSIN